MRSVKAKLAELLLPEKPVLKAPAPTPVLSAPCDDESAQTEKLLVSAALTIALEEAVTADLEGSLKAEEHSQEQRSTPEAPPGTPTGTSATITPTQLLREAAKKASSAAVRSESFTPDVLPATPGQVITLQPPSGAKTSRQASGGGVKEEESSERDFDSPPSNDVSIAAPGCRSTGSRYYEARSTLGPLPGNLDAEYPHYSMSRLKAPKVATLGRSLSPQISISDSDSGELPVQNLALRLEQLDPGLASTAASRPNPGPSRLGRSRDQSQGSVEDMPAWPEAEDVPKQQTGPSQSCKPRSSDSYGESEPIRTCSFVTDATSKAEQDMQLADQPADNDILTAASEHIEWCQNTKQVIGAVEIHIVYQADVQQLMETNEELSLSLGASKAAEQELSRRNKEALQAQRRTEQLLQNAQQQIQALLAQLNTDKELMELLDARFHAIMDADNASDGSSNGGLSAACKTAKVMTARCKDLSAQKASVQQQLAAARSEAAVSEQSRGMAEARAALLQSKLDGLDELRSLWQVVNGTAEMTAEAPAKEAAPAGSIVSCRKPTEPYPGNNLDRNLQEAPPAQLLVLMGEYLEARSTIRQLQTENRNLQLELGTAFAKAIYPGSRIPEEQQSSVKAPLVTASSIRSYPTPEAEAFEFTADSEMTDQDSVPQEKIGQTLAVQQQASSSEAHRERSFAANEQLLGRLYTMMKTSSETTFELQERLAIISKSLGCKTLQFERAVRQCSALTSINEDLRAENADLKDVVANTKESLAKVQDDMAGFEAQMATIAQQMASSEQEGAEMSAKCTHLEQQLEKQRYELEGAKRAKEEALKALSETEARAVHNHSLATLYRQAYKRAKRSKSASS